MESENTKRGEKWKDTEVLEMLNCIKNEHISNLVNNKSKRNRKVFDKIAIHMKNKGFKRDGFQIKNKFMNLKADYYKVKNCNDKTILQKHACEYFFKLLDEIFDNHRLSHSTGVISDTDINATVDSQNAIADKSDEIEEPQIKNPRFINTQEFLDLKDEPDLFEAMESENSESTEHKKKIRGKKWSDIEVEEMLNCIKKDHITNLFDKKPNQKVFYKIALHMKNKGFDRSWYKIRAKFNFLKADYYKIKNCSDKSAAQRQTCEYFTLLDEMFSNRPDVIINEDEDETVDILRTEKDTKSKAEDSKINKQKTFSDPKLLFSTKKSKDQPAIDKNLAGVWLSKLRQMSSSQKVYAEKFISDILFEGVLGNLHRNAIEINAINTTSSSFQKLNTQIQEIESASVVDGGSIKKEVTYSAPDQM